ncbi:DUF6412 domain-containing protein [Glaciihabitans sp. dw_435]|uniref:DUF6412 domain-containing protein n=1 Tax=Glaciihabitans sp. dw_435 TaxID=2720081 RepID=UPI001BD5FF3D|nr:DUF6412 domain-containing protein [Glaciihabitans sp. dw_435]
MRSIYTRLVALASVSFVVMMLVGAQPSSVAIAGLAAVAVAAVLGARYAGVALRARHLTVGARAREHRESLREMPAPRHPDTAGRPRTRAPSRPFLAA